MKFLQAIALSILFVELGGCRAKNDGARYVKNDASAPDDVNLLKARAGFTTNLVRRISEGGAAPEPPVGVLQLVKYRGELGEMSAYVSPSPADGKKHPAIIWITGGYSNSIGTIDWEAAPPENDQSGRAFREAGIVMMYPSLRGGNDNPGFKESFFGEVNDVLAAAAYLQKLDYVDPSRIYLAGHSTGATLAMLVAESSARFRAIFAFGPIDDARRYGPDEMEFDFSDAREADLRSPIRRLQAIQTPVFVFEGTIKPSNTIPMNAMMQASRNPLIHFLPVSGATHFTVVSPATRLVAEKILLDHGGDMNITFTKDELAGLLK